MFSLNQCFNYAVPLFNFYSAPILVKYSLTMKRIHRSRSLVRPRSGLCKAVATCGIMLSVSPVTSFAFSPSVPVFRPVPSFGWIGDRVSSALNVQPVQPRSSISMVATKIASSKPTSKSFNSEAQPSGTTSSASVSWYLKVSVEFYLLITLFCCFDCPCSRGAGSSKNKYFSEVIFIS